MRWVKLGDFIEQCDERNTDNVFSEHDVRGISTTKLFITTKANLDGVSLSAYKIVKEKEFAYVPDTSRRGDKISLGFNNLGNSCIVSSISCVFKVKDIDLIWPEYLYLWFCRPEFDRYARYNSWGSAREAFSYDDVCRIEIPLPSIDEQKEIVAAWCGLKNLYEQNEQMVNPLMDLCQSYLQDLKHKYPLVEIGPYIEEVNERNSDNKYGVSVLKGVTNGNKFDSSKAITDGLSFTNYKIVKRDCFAYNPARINIGSIAINQEGICIISPMYLVFKVRDTRQQELLSDFLMLWFTRAEFQRSTLFYAAGSVRNTFSFQNMCRVKIPLPPIEIQRTIVDIYNCVSTAQYIADNAKQLAYKACHALIRQVIGDNQ